MPKNSEHPVVAALLFLLAHLQIQQPEAAKEIKVHRDALANIDPSEPSKAAPEPGAAIQLSSRFDTRFGGALEQPPTPVSDEVQDDIRALVAKHPELEPLLRKVTGYEPPAQPSQQQGGNQ